MSESELVCATAAALGISERRLWRWWRGEWIAPVYLWHRVQRALHAQGFELIDSAPACFGRRPRWYRRLPAGADRTIRLRGT